MNYEEKVQLLNKYTKAYDEGNPLISDKEWDDLYFEIVQEEKRTGSVSPDSPTSSIQFDVVNGLKKIEHSHPMLSLAKTKDIEDVKKFAGNKETIVMAKMDGLTCSLTYENGKLVQAETRGNGRIGEDVLHNAKHLVPNRIPATGRTVIDGEVICKYDDFEEFADTYKNPRNFASGSIRLLDANECAKRKLTFVAWDLIESDEKFTTLSEKLEWLSSWFKVVPYEVNSFDTDALKNTCKDKNYPIDGLVFKYNDTAFYEELGFNDHHPLGGLAFKFYDELYDTTLRGIKFSIGRTGVLTPIAEFDPVDIDGTNVRNASLHNLSIMEEILGVPKIGQPIKVFKANMIIPQVESADKCFNGTEIEIPAVCPRCGKPLTTEKKYATKYLICANNCNKANNLLHFISTVGIDGLSIKTVEKLIDWGWLNSFSDIYKLENHRQEWIKKTGFEEKSVDKMLQNIEKSRKVEAWQVISAAGILGVQKNTAKKLIDKFKTFDNFISAVDNKFDFSSLKDIGPSTAKTILEFDYSDIIDVAKYLIIEEKNTQGKLSGMKFCITGKLETYKNRQALVQEIESLGGTIAAVNKDLDYLISNEQSNSNKMKAAEKYGVKIITEQEFINRFIR